MAMDQSQIAKTSVPLRIYYARPMDCLDPSTVSSADDRFRVLLNRYGFILSNPYHPMSSSILEPETVVRENQRLMKTSNVLIADVSYPDYGYVGLWFEIADAHKLGLPVVLCIGDNNFHHHRYVHYYCDFITRNLEDAVLFIHRCCSLSGIQEQLTDTKAYYDSVARDYLTNIKTICSWRSSPNSNQSYQIDYLTDSLKKACAGHTVLEIGCGDGRWTDCISSVAKAICCVDFSSNMLSELQKRITFHCESVKFICADVFRVEAIEIASYDVVVCFFLIGLIPPIMQKVLLHKLSRQCSQNALLAFAVTAEFSSAPYIGMGRRRLELRTCDQTYKLYKEVFSNQQLQLLLQTTGFEVVDKNNELTDFAYCLARPATKLA
jgi:ubiquinone/menaquinone biosynthesis C-methylase UbiE